MADASLSILLPGIPERVAGERVEVRPIVLRELRMVERVMEGWAVLVQSDGEVILPEAWDAFLDILGGAIGATRNTVLAYDQSDFQHLVCLMLAINKNIWDPEHSEVPSDSFTWAQIIQRLVKAGHPRESIMEMTLAQAKAFLEEGLRQEREDLAMDITAASFSMADGATVQKVTKELRRG
jgi:hypothetical protein